MPIARVMFVMPASCVVEIEVPEGTETDEAIDLAYQQLPGFTDQNWDASDAEAYNAKGEPHSFTIEA